MMKLLSAFLPLPVIFALVALGSFSAGGATTYLVLDAIYDFDGSSRLRKSIKHAAETIKERDDKQAEDEAKIKELETKLERLRNENSIDGDRNCIGPNDSWLRNR